MGFELRGLSAHQDAEQPALSDDLGGHAVGRYADDGGGYREGRQDDGRRGHQIRAGTESSTGAFLAAVETFVRHMAIGLDLPYGFLYDLSLLGGVAQRVEVVFAQRRLDYWQQHLLAENVLNPVRDAVLQDAIARRILPPAFRRTPDGRLVESWKEGAWNFGPKLTGDAGHQTNADIQLVQAGLKAPEDLTKEYSGKSYRHVTDRIAANIQTNQRVATETNIPVELQAPLRLQNGSQLLGAMQQPPPEPPPPGSQAAIGDKGAANVVDILAKVTVGDLDRDAAIQTLVTVYNIPLDTAEEIVPHPKKQRDNKKKTKPNE